jgi:hypothetical protein
VSNDLNSEPDQDSIPSMFLAGVYGPEILALLVVLWYFLFALPQMDQQPERGNPPSVPYVEGIYGE